eukprot:1141265-Pelagomonas_calceolata.AAC.1
MEFRLAVLALGALSLGCLAQDYGSEGGDSYGDGEGDYSGGGGEGDYSGGGDYAYDGGGGAGVWRRARTSW